MREAQAAAALDHPNICTVCEFDEAEETTFISMANIEGQSLKKKIDSGPLEQEEALRIFVPELGDVAVSIKVIVTILVDLAIFIIVFFHAVLPLGYPLLDTVI